MIYRKVLKDTAGNCREYEREGGVKFNCGSSLMTSYDQGSCKMARTLSCLACPSLDLAYHHEATAEREGHKPTENLMKQ
jgi:hypothetical protein